MAGSLYPPLVARGLSVVLAEEVHCLCLPLLVSNVHVCLQVWLCFLPLRVGLFIIWILFKWHQKTNIKPGK